MLTRFGSSSVDKLSNLPMQLVTMFLAEWRMCVFICMHLCEYACACKYAYGFRYACVFIYMHLFIFYITYLPFSYIWIVLCNILLSCILILHNCNMPAHSPSNEDELYMTQSCEY